SRKYYLIHSSQDISPTIQKFVEWIYQELEQLKSNTH
ncbi:LysR family transcriptional regulator, partial [Acinetobacter baumannii]